MFSYNITLSIKANSGIVDSILIFDFLRETTSYYILVKRFSQSTEQLSCLTLIISLVIWEQGFLILKHILSCIWSYKHLWKNYDICSILGCFLIIESKFYNFYIDHFSCSSKVVLFISYCFNLQKNNKDPDRI